MCGMFITLGDFRCLKICISIAQRGLDLYCTSLVSVRLVKRERSPLA